MINTKALKQNATTEAQEREYRWIIFNLRMRKVLLGMMTETETIANNTYDNQYTNNDNNTSGTLSGLVHSGQAQPFQPFAPESKGKESI